MKMLRCLGLVCLGMSLWASPLHNHNCNPPMPMGPFFDAEFGPDGSSGSGTRCQGWCPAQCPYEIVTAKGTIKCFGPYESCFDGFKKEYGQFIDCNYGPNWNPFFPQETRMKHLIAMEIPRF